MSSSTQKRQFQILKLEERIAPTRWWNGCEQPQEPPNCEEPKEPPCEPQKPPHCGQPQEPPPCEPQKPPCCEQPQDPCEKDNREVSTTANIGRVQFGAKVSAG
jgi:hypothetical protein